MSTTRPTSSDLTITGLAHQTYTAPTTLRYWTDRELIPHRRDSAGRRLYGPDAVDAVRRLKADRFGRRARS